MGKIITYMHPHTVWWEEEEHYIMGRVPPPHPLPPAGGLLICWTTCALLHKHSSLALKQLKHVEVAQ